MPLRFSQNRPGASMQSVVSMAWSAVTGKPGIVLYDTAQSLTDDQQAQARENIGATSVEDIAGYVVGTRAVAVTTVIPTDVLAVRTTGYSVIGKGAALYKRVVSEPAHAGWFQDAAGAYFELADTHPDPYMFGASGGATGNDRLLLDAWLEYGRLVSHTLYGVPDEFWADTKVQMTRHSGTRIYGRGMKIKQSSTTLGTSGTDRSVLLITECDNCYIENIEFDGNSAAKIAANPPSGVHLSCGVRTVDCFNITFRGCWAHHTVEHGFSADVNSASTDLSAQNTFSDAVLVRGAGDARYFRYAITDTWAGTLTLQKSLVSASTDFADVSGETWTANETDIFRDDEADGTDVWYRIGFKTGQYTSGNADIRLTPAGDGQEYIDCLATHCGNYEQRRGYGYFAIGYRSRVRFIGCDGYENCQGIGVDEASSGGTGNENAFDVVISDCISLCSFDAYRIEGTRRFAMIGCVGVAETDLLNETGSDSTGLMVRDIQGNPGLEWGVISGCVLQGAQSGILLHDAQSVSISGCVIIQRDDNAITYTEGQAAIDILTETDTKPTRGVNISDCQIETYQGVGVRIGAHPTQAASPAYNREISLTDNRLRFRGSSTAIAGQVGLLTTASVTINLDCSGNKFYDFYDGVVSTETDTNTGRNSTYRNNNLARTVRYGMSFDGAAPRLISGNISRDAGTADLRIEAAANISGNVLSSNKFTTVSGTYSTITQVTPSVGLTFTPSSEYSMFLRNDTADQALTGGVRITALELNGGSAVTTGTLTLDPGDRPVQRYTNGGAHTLAPGSNAGEFSLTITNNASAGAITTSGFTYVTGDAFDTTNLSRFRCRYYNDGTFSELYVRKVL